MTNYIKLIFSLILVVFSFQCLAQDNWDAKPKIIITQRPQTVPKGKRWVLLSDKKTTIQISDGTLNSGTLCNAMFLSNPQIIFNLNKGGYRNPETFGIIFKGLNKVPYTNDYTYNITPISIINKDFSLNDLQYKSPEEAGSREIDFNEGESVYVNNCLESIELTEINLLEESNTEKIKGNTLSKNYNGSGSGGVNGLTMTQRSFVNKPSIVDDKKQIGKVVIEMRVDKSGNVIYASVARGTTITDSNLLKECEDAVKNSKLNALENAPDSQEGRFVFVFKGK
jgi:hypothetical protein